MLSNFEFIIMQNSIERMTDKQLDAHFDKVRDRDREKEQVI